MVLILERERTFICPLGASDSERKILTIIGGLELGYTY